MSASVDLFALLAADAGIGALVADRIYPDAAPQDADRPYIVYERTGTAIEHTIDSVVASSITSLTVGCYGNGYASVESVADAVQAALSGSAALDAVGRAGSYDPEVGVYIATVSVAHYG